MVVSLVMLRRCPLSGDTDAVKVVSARMMRPLYQDHDLSSNCYRPYQLRLTHFLTIAVAIDSNSTAAASLVEAQTTSLTTSYRCG